MTVAGEELVATFGDEDRVTGHDGSLLGLDHLA
jgi:hypothetical protein